MRLLSSLTIATVFTLALCAAPANAKDKDKTGAGGALPPVFQAVVDCRALAADADRLACFDRSVAAMASARDKQDLVVADRATINETKRGLFGFSLPKLKLFGSTEGEDVNEIETTISTVRKAPDGFAVFVLPDGARWKQTDGGISFAKPGDKIRIRRGAMNGYLAKVASDATIRVIRLAQ
ncbi:hypothetical protein [Novosphingobium sp. FKTRR1]|uniref:hypothetical protein n=1 Tax=Novosphingobium sp. FKTRR1 TaxID=2879118 RepID=UPI001CF06DC3|nr:hypothetical protein [Novosphingobium sp. FKTRR1]